MDAVTFIRMRYERMHTDAQRKAQQRVREAALKRQPKPPGRYAVRSTPADLPIGPRLPIGAPHLERSSEPRQTGLGSHSGFVRLSSLPALTLETPEHLWVYALVPASTSAYHASEPEASPALDAAAQPSGAALLERRAVGHCRLALALLAGLGDAAPPQPQPQTQTQQQTQQQPQPHQTQQTQQQTQQPQQQPQPQQQQRAQRLDLAFEHLMRMHALLSPPAASEAQPFAPAPALPHAGARGGGFGPGSEGGARAGGRSRPAAQSGQSGAPGPVRIEGTRRAELLAVCFSNLACFYARRSLPRPALDFCFRAAELELKIGGRVEFSTHLRTAAVLSALSCHEDALRHCEHAWKSLLLSARCVPPQPPQPAPVRPGTSGGAPPASAAQRRPPSPGVPLASSAHPAAHPADERSAGELGEEAALSIEQLPPEYQAAAAVVCANIAACLYRLHRHAEALEVALQAEVYAARSLAPAHPHRTAIHASARYARIFDEFSQKVLLQPQLGNVSVGRRGREETDADEAESYRSFYAGEDERERLSFPSITGPRVDSSRH